MAEVPWEPLAFIRKCVRSRHVLWTYHANMRLERRNITRSEILDSVDSYEIIEEYPDDKYLPSYLVIASERFHILFATDVAENNVRIVTAYWPDPKEWESDLRTRRARS